LKKSLKIGQMMLNMKKQNIIMKERFLVEIGNIMNGRNKKTFSNHEQSAGKKDSSYRVSSSDILFTHIFLGSTPKSVLA